MHGRVLGLVPSAISARPEWRATSGGEPQAAASAATIPNASGKIDGVTPLTSASAHRCARWRCSRRPSEERTAGRGGFEIRAPRTEADDHRTGLHALERLEEQRHTFPSISFLDVDHRSPVTGEERSSAPRCRSG